MEKDTSVKNQESVSYQASIEKPSNYPDSNQILPPWEHIEDFILPGINPDNNIFFGKNHNPLSSKGD